MATAAIQSPSRTVRTISGTAPEAPVSGTAPEAPVDVTAVGPALIEGYSTGPIEVQADYG